MNNFTPRSFRKNFPLIERSTGLSEDKSTPLVYFDNAATTQKFSQVIRSQDHYYNHYNANVHRASHELSTKATFAFENARELLQNFIKASSPNEVIWTKGTTESLNIIVQCMAKKLLNPGDEIVLGMSEHHANIVPWQMITEETGAKIKVLPLTEQGYIDEDKLDEIITSNVKFVACAHISNVLGRINPIEKIIHKAKSVGAISIIDGAQAVAHIPINVKKLDCDFYVFSAHKMFGPTGVGVLYGKQHLLEEMQPYQGGGEMIKSVSFNESPTFNVLPFKFEAGTPNIAGVVGFGESIQCLSPLLSDSRNAYYEYEKQLTTYCYNLLSEIEAVVFIAKGLPDIGVISFTVTGHHNHDIASALDSYGIAVRSGHHCAMPLMESLNLSGCIRVSLAAYNSIEEVDYLVKFLNKAIKQEPLQRAANQTSEYIPTSALSEVDNILDLFSKTKGWDGRHREIMMLGKQLPRMDKSLRNDESLIAGCESLAWLKAEKSESGCYNFSADSDAKIIRGLLVIVLALFNHKNAQEISKLDINDYFLKLGLIKHLSPSRSNGLLAIVDKIKFLVQK